jgi:hypothetical protein
MTILLVILLENLLEITLSYSKVLILMATMLKMEANLVVKKERIFNTYALEIKIAVAA